MLKSDSTRAILCAFSFLVGFILPLKAAKKDDIHLVRPPMPESSSVQAYIGEKKVFILRVGGRTRDPLRIILRKKPSVGYLAQPLQVNQGEIRFEYSVPPKAAPGSDSFVYAVQSVDSPVSAPARVDITLIERPPKLITVPEVDFSSVDLGGVSKKKISILNAGGASAVLHPKVLSPWFVLDKVPVVIPKGEERALMIRFEPTQAAAFNEKLTLDDTTFVTLRGQATIPIDWPASGIQFDALARQSGEIIFPISNREDAARIVSFKWPKFFKAPIDIELAARESKKVKISLREGPAFSTQGEVPISSGSFKGAIPFSVSPAPPKVILNPAQPIDFDAAVLGSPLHGLISINNEGGLPIQLRLAIPKSIKILSQAAELVVAPGETVALDFFWTPTQSGYSEERVRVLSGGDQIGEFIFSANVKASQAVEKLLALPPTPTPASTTKPEQPRMAALPPVEECFLAESTPHSVTISWKLTSPDTKEFLVERRVIRSGPEGRVIEHWEPWRQVDIQIAGDTATAHFRKLAPGTFWNIRLRGIDSKGLAGPPTPGHFRIETLPINRWKIPFWIWMPTAVLLAGGSFLFLKKRVRFQIGENLDQRIARLEK
jgi:hypothetical protein